MNTTHQELSLPKEIKKHWKILCCLSINKDSELYLLGGKSGEEAKTMKVIPRNDFSVKKYKKQSCMKEETLLLPEKHIYSSGFHYILYPRLNSLEGILCQDGLTPFELLSLGIDMTCAGEALINSRFCEADISPNNIYQRNNGCFCLGDLSLQTTRTEGTPGYIAPEHSSKGTHTKIKRSSFISFDRELQYSICQLLDTIFQLNTSVQNIDDKGTISELFHRGTQKLPDSRFSSLQELRKALEEQRQSIEAENPYSLFRIKEKSHPMFQVKTLLIEKKSLSPFFFLWGILIIAGCIFLASLFSSADSIPAESSAAFAASSKPSIPITASPSSSSGITISPDSSATAVSSPSLNPQTEIEDEEQTEPQELDIQKMGLSSLDFALHQTKKPQEVSCIYGGENQLTDISCIDQFPNLKELYLNKNKIQTLPELNSLKHLEILVLSYNQLEKLPKLSGLSSLRYLDLSSNPDFHDINSLRNLTQLTTLNIAGTGISKQQCQTLARELPGCNIIY